MPERPPAECAASGHEVSAKNNVIDHSYHKYHKPHTGDQKRKDISFINPWIYLPNIKQGLCFLRRVARFHGKINVKLYPTWASICVGIYVDRLKAIITTKIRYMISISSRNVFIWLSSAFYIPTHANLSVYLKCSYVYNLKNCSKWRLKYVDCDVPNRMSHQHDPTRHSVFSKTWRSGHGRSSGVGKDTT